MPRAVCSFLALPGIWFLVEEFPVISLCKHRFVFGLGSICYFSLWEDRFRHGIDPTSSWIRALWYAINFSALISWHPYHRPPSRASLPPCFLGLRHHFLTCRSSFIDPSRPWAASPLPLFWASHPRFLPEHGGFLPRGSTLPPERAQAASLCHPT